MFVSSKLPSVVQPSPTPANYRIPTTGSPGYSANPAVSANRGLVETNTTGSSAPPNVDEKLVEQRTEEVRLQDYYNQELPQQRDFQQPTEFSGFQTKHSSRKGSPFISGFRNPAATLNDEQSGREMPELLQFFFQRASEVENGAVDQSALKTDEDETTLAVPLTTGELNSSK